MASMTTMKTRIAFGIKIDFRASSTVKADIAGALARWRKLSGSELAEAVSRDPGQALRSIGKDLPAELLAEAVSRAPGQALRSIGKDLPAELLAEAVSRDPGQAIQSIGKDLPAELLAWCRARV